MDYYNIEERETQQAWANTRDRVLRPLINVLKAASITPNMVTLMSIVFLLLGCVVFENARWLAFPLLFLYGFLDSVDGPLSRATGTSNEGGALVDMVADQLGIILVPAAAVYNLGANGPLMVLFSSVYLAFIVLVTYANAEKIQTPRFVRIKGVVFLLYGACVYFEKDWVTPFIAVFLPYYVLMFSIVLRRLYVKLVEIKS
jgi:phosphatidylglycerophosphate synthase